MSDTQYEAVEAEGRHLSRGRDLIKAYFYKRRWKIALRSLIAAFAVVLLWPFVTIVIPPGKVGVVFSPLFGGTEIDSPLTEGLNFVLPWNKVYIYNARVEVRNTEFEALASDGLRIKVGVIYRFRIHPSTAGRLHKAFGPTFPLILMDPAINSVVRAMASNYAADEIYGAKRGELQERIYQGIIADGNYNMIEAGGDPREKNQIVVATPAGLPPPLSGYVPLVELVDIVITNVKLPQLVREAIEKKAEQQQIMQEYVYRIDREKSESQRKQIEAEGIRDFQKTVQSGISDAYLRWRGIEATLRLATSPNSKTVIIGGGRSGLPLILNMDDSGKSGETVQASVNRVKPKADAKAKAAPSSMPNDSIDLSASDKQGSIGK